MKELQMLVNKWKYEADNIKNKSGAAVNFDAMPIAAEWRRLRKCITEAQLLLDEVTKSDTPPQLNKHDCYTPLPDIKPVAGCRICGGTMVLIRGKYPNDNKREICPTCAQERLDQIAEISQPDYGMAYKSNGV